VTQPKRRKLLLSLTATVALFGGAEGALRIYGFRFNAREVPLTIWNPQEDKQFDSLQALHRSDPSCLWVPQPRADVPWGSGESINARGHRGQLLELEPEDPPFRVAFLGDSSTFGWGVHQEKTFAAACSSLLTAEGVQAESLNAGVIGYSIAQGHARYRELVRPHRPDVVVIAFGAVNDHLNGPGQESDDSKMKKIAAQESWAGSARAWLRGHLRIVHWISWMRYKRQGGEAALRDRYRSSRRQDLSLLERVGKREYPGVRRVSLREYRRHIDELVAEVEADGARAILLSMPRKLTTEESFPVLEDYSLATESAAERLKIPLVDLRARFRAFGEEREGELFIDYWHPKPRAHKLIAEDLQPLLQSIAAERGHQR